MEVKSFERVCLKLRDLNSNAEVHKTVRPEKGGRVGVSKASEMFAADV